MEVEFYEVRRPEPWNEPGVVEDRLRLTPEQVEEVEAALKEYPGRILVKVNPPVYRPLTGKYTLP